VSRRKRRPGSPARAGTPAQPGGSTQADRPVATPGPAAEPRPLRRLALDLAVLGTLVAATVGIAELAGAANLGVALGIGQVVFAIALVVLLIRD
jgi:hypothetical protein